MEFVRKPLKSKSEGNRAGRAGGSKPVPEGEVLPTVDNQEFVKAAPCSPEEPNCARPKPSTTSTTPTVDDLTTKRTTTVTLPPTTSNRTVEYNKYTTTLEGNLTMTPTSPSAVTMGNRHQNSPVTLTPSSTNGAGKGLFTLDSTTAAIIGGATGAVVLILFILVAILLCLLCKRKGGKKRQRAMAENPQYTTESEFQLYDRINENPDPENPYHEPYDHCVAPPLPEPRPPYNGLAPESARQDRSHYSGLLKVNSLYYNKKKNKGRKEDGTPYAVVPIEPSQRAPKVPSAESPDLSDSRETRTIKEPHYYVLESPEAQLKSQNIRDTKESQMSDKGPHYYTLEPPIAGSESKEKDESEDYTKPAEIAANRRPEYLELIESDDQMSTDSGHGTSSFKGKAGPRYIMENKNNSNNFSDEFESYQTDRKVGEEDEYTDRKTVASDETEIKSVSSEDTDRKVVAEDNSRGKSKSSRNQRYIDHPVFSIT